MNKNFFSSCFGSLSLFIGSFASALVIVPDGFNHTVAPNLFIDKGIINTSTGELIGDPGWDHVGSMNSASCIFLGNYTNGSWFLTAAHVYSGGVTSVWLNGSKYTTIGNSAVRLENNADLVMFQVTPDANLLKLDSLAIAPSPSLGASIVVMGYGYSGQGPATYWVRNGGIWSQSDPNTSNAVRGVRNTSVLTKQWAVGQIASTGLSFSLNSGRTNLFSSQMRLGTDFNAILGDSGSAAFVYTGDEWALAGVPLAISSATGPSGYTMDGSRTYYGDLSAYSPQIFATLGPIPEPSIIGFFVLSAGVCLLRRRRV